MSKDTSKNIQFILLNYIAVLLVKLKFRFELLTLTLAFQAAEFYGKYRFFNLRFISKTKAKIKPRVMTKNTSKAKTNFEIEQKTLENALHYDFFQLVTFK